MEAWVIFLLKNLYYYWLCSTSHLLHLVLHNLNLVIKNCVWPVLSVIFSQGSVLWHELVLQQKAAGRVPAVTYIAVWVHLLNVLVQQLLVLVAELVEGPVLMRLSRTHLAFERPGWTRSRVVRISTRLKLLPTKLTFDKALLCQVLLLVHHQVLLLAHVALRDAVRLVVM